MDPCPPGRQFGPVMTLSAAYAFLYARGRPRLWAKCVGKVNQARRKYSRAARGVTLSGTRAEKTPSSCRDAMFAGRSDPEPRRDPSADMFLALQALQMTAQKNAAGLLPPRSV